MVEFCKICNVSLPEADRTIKNGKVYVSHDYRCPECGGLANPLLYKYPVFGKRGCQDIFVKSEEGDVIIKDGKVEVC